jgi:hypothetical protein
MVDNRHANMTLMDDPPHTRNTFVPFPFFNDPGGLDVSGNTWDVIDVLVAITSGKSPPIALF